MINCITDTISKLTKNRELLCKCILFGLYFCLHFALCFFHEPWRDEAQAYLIVRDLSFSEIFHQLTVEGHPFLWYMAMLIPVKLGLSVHFLSFISFILVLIGAYVFIFHAPFKIYVKALILPSMLFTYSLPIIARDYCLVALLLVLVGYFYPKRYQTPLIYGLLIFLLPQIHVIMAGFAIMLAVVSLIEILISPKNRKVFSNYIPLLSGLFGTIILILQLRAGSSLLDFNDETPMQYFLHILGNIPLMVKTLLLACIDAIKYFWEIFNAPLLTATLFLLLFCLLINLILFKYYWKEFLILLGGAGAHIFIHAYIWGYIPQRTICTVFIFFIYVWMIYSYKDYQYTNKKMLFLEKVFKKYALALILFLCIISYQLSYQSVKQDFRGNYSGAEETALFIKNELPEDAIVISAAKDFYITPIIAHYNYNDNKIWNPATLDYERTFVDWNNRGNYIGEFAELIQMIKTYFNESDNLYILNAEGCPLANTQWEQYELVFSQVDSPCVWGETYSIYKFNWEH